MDKKQSFQKSIKYWKDGPLKDLAVAKNLFEKGFYHQCLFFGHLSLEKMLKALFMKRTKKVAPFIHDLRRLAGLMELLLVKRKREEVIAGLEPVGFTEKDFRDGSSFIEEIKKTGVVL